MPSLLNILGIIGVLLLAYPLLLGAAFLTLATNAQLHAWVDASWWFWPTLAGLLGGACVALVLARRLRVRPADLDLALRGGTSALVTGVVLMPMGMGVLDRVFGPLRAPPASVAEALFGLTRALAIAVGLLGAAMLALVPLGLAVAKLREEPGNRRLSRHRSHQDAAAAAWPDRRQDEGEAAMTTDRGQHDATGLRDAEGRRWQVETVTAPAAWASALVNNDWSGLEADPADAEACRAWLAEQAAEGWRVVNVARERDGKPGEAWFSASAGRYGSAYEGADLLDYVRQRTVPA